MNQNLFLVFRFTRSSCGSSKCTAKWKLFYWTKCFLVVVSSCWSTFKFRSSMYRNTYKVTEHSRLLDFVMYQAWIRGSCWADIMLYSYASISFVYNGRLLDAFSSKSFNNTPSKLSIRPSDHHLLILQSETDVISLCSINQWKWVTTQCAYRVSTTLPFQGVRGLYRGYLTTILREVPFSFIQFPVWEQLKVGEALSIWFCALTLSHVTTVSPESQICLSWIWPLK